MKNPFIPIEERPQNTVDKLLAKIQEKQENCVHDFYLIEPIPLKKSRVKNVYILFEDPAYMMGLSRRRWKWLDVSLLRCIKCNKEKKINITITCPHCLGKLKMGKISPDRKKYFGEEYMAFETRLYSGSNCKFMGVADEWGIKIGG